MARIFPIQSFENSMPFSSFLQFTLSKRIYVAVFVTTALLYIVPRQSFRESVSTLHAFTPSGSHYNDEYWHNSSLEPAAAPPSFDFLDLSRLNEKKFSHAHYNPYFRSIGSEERSRKPCVGPRGIDINANSDDMLLAYAVKPPGKYHFPCTGSAA